MEKLLHLLRLTQNELKREVYHILKEKKMNPIYKDGFVYAEGDIPILLVAHMDTVFKKPPAKIIYNEKKDLIYNPHGGLGGDDRCGVYAILKLLEKYKPHILFTEDEEIGCIGAYKAVDTLPKPNIKFIIEIDRKGSNDCVFYECGNESFIKYIEAFGFKSAKGTCSDISVLGSVWDIAAVNISSGYYNEHTSREFVIFKELQNNIKRISIILERHKSAPYFDYQSTYLEPAQSFFYEDINDELFWYLYDYYERTGVYPKKEEIIKRAKEKDLGRRNKYDF